MYKKVMLKHKDVGFTDDASTARVFGRSPSVAYGAFAEFQSLLRV